ncbi:conserved hypothetical protein [Tenacibaculum litopenaei]|jgi:hypothetical protein|uniref:DUF6970 domain-containing protein n=1 Tax=Tenacibaculum litopenaei TaxID=396016 RepID=UPI0038960BA4
MKKLIVFLIALSFLSCEDSKPFTNTCNASDPITQLPWLQSIKTSLEQSTTAGQKEIIQYFYKNQTVYLVNPCKGCADNLITVYNCTGEKVCEFGGVAGLNTCPDFETTKTNEIILWTK